MKRSKFTDAQIIEAIKRVEAGLSVQNGGITRLMSLTPEPLDTIGQQLAYQFSVQLVLTVEFRNALSATDQGGLGLLCCM